ncbi:MAG: hypothetical protein ACRC0Y_03085, partial [Fusobacteriaceae bacterium]
MSINLKSFQKLFFIIFFSVISLSLMCSDELVHLPNKIGPELEKIEALPRRTKPAELNIEVTKIKSEVLNEVYIDRKSKNIYVDFSQKKAKTLKNVKTIEDLENKYNLVVTETLKSSGLVKGKQKNKIMDNPPVMKYELVTFEGDKVLKIPFENEPQKLYITVEESASKNIVKVYSLDIKNSNIVLETINEFEVTSSMRDIVILPPSDGEPAKVEYPDNWVKITQLVPDKDKFPVIGINKPSWIIETDRPLNPIDKKPTAILDLGEAKIEVPVNIRETPYQNTQKFLVYDRGDMTNRNIAIGAYTPISSTTGTGLNNLVKGDFEVVLEPEVI